MAMRCSIRSRCGDVNRPVRYPAADNAAAIMADVEPLPFVPATWMTGILRSGEPIASSSWRIRSSPIRGVIGHLPPALIVLSTEQELDGVRSPGG